MSVRLLEECKELAKAKEYLLYLREALQHELEISQIAKVDGWTLISKMEGAERVSKALLKHKAFVEPPCPTRPRPPTTTSRAAAARATATGPPSARCPCRPPLGNNLLCYELRLMFIIVPSK